MRTMIQNVRPWGAAPADLLIDGSAISAVVPAGTGSADEVIDGRALLALPGFVNAHAHIDKSWWGMPWVSYGGQGTTQGRIAHERAERDRYGIPSLDATEAVLREFLRLGTTRVRTHVDVDLGVGLRGIEAVRGAAARLGGAVEVEIVAFPQDGVMRRPGVLELLDEAVAAGASHVGGLDPALIDRDPLTQLDGLFRIAAERDAGLDIHLHDGGTLGRWEYELVAERTRDFGRQGRVNVSHGFALGAIPLELVDELAELGISWTTVAPVRSTPLPLARIRENGMRIGLGTDGIRDLWSPYGDGDILGVANTFARLHGLVRDEDLRHVVELASSRAAGFVGADTHDLVPGARADVVLLDAQNAQDALTRSPRRELVMAGGRVVVSAGEVLV